MFIRVSFVVVIVFITVSQRGTYSAEPEGTINVPEARRPDIPEARKPGIPEAKKPDIRLCTEPEYDRERKPQEEIHTERTCKLPIDEGLCFANFAYWGYKPELNACVKFHYGGCDGNDNRFETLEDCIETCVMAT